MAAEVARHLPAAGGMPRDVFGWSLERSNTWLLANVSAAVHALTAPLGPLSHGGGGYAPRAVSAASRRGYTRRALPSKTLARSPTDSGAGST